MEKWISVKDKSPELGTYVLAFTIETTMVCIIVTTHFTRYFTHWMPLPEPPKEK
jgi:hypothetical protein